MSRTIVSLGDVIAVVRDRNRERLSSRLLLRMSFRLPINRSYVMPPMKVVPPEDIPIYQPREKPYWATLGDWERDVIALNAQLEKTGKRAVIRIWLPMGEA